MDRCSAACLSGFPPEIECFAFESYLIYSLYSAQCSELPIDERPKQNKRKSAQLWINIFIQHVWQPFFIHIESNIQYVIFSLHFTTFFTTWISFMFSLSEAIFVLYLGVVYCTDDVRCCWWHRRIHTHIYWSLLIHIARFTYTWIWLNDNMAVFIVLLFQLKSSHRY